MNIKLLVSAIVSEHNVSVNWCREVAVNFANLDRDCRRVITIMERPVSVINILILASLVASVPGAQSDIFSTGTHSRLPLYTSDASTVPRLSAGRKFAGARRR